MFQPSIESRSSQANYGENTDEMKDTTENATDDLNSYILIVPRPSKDEQKSSRSPPSHRKNISGQVQTDCSEELQHASYMNMSEDMVDFNEEVNGNEITSKTSRRSSQSDSLKIEIQDWGNEGSFNFTTCALRKCKLQVLSPYWGLLSFIGWRGFQKDSVYSPMYRWRVLNVVYPSIMVLLLFYTYMYEILACEWKLNIDSEVIQTPTPAPTPSTTPNHTRITVTWSHLNTAVFPVLNLTKGVSRNIGCDHIVTTYLIPNFLHFLAYVMGIYYFRIQENEQLYALMEKVFLQATPVQTTTASQQKMIYKLRLFLVFGALWVVMTVVLQCLYLWAFSFPKMPLFETIGIPGYWVLFSLELIGRTAFNSVILAIVMNYATQCEMIKFYMKGLVMRLQEKSTDLKIAMKDVLMLRQSLGMLNGMISNMTSLAAIILGELTVIGVCILFLNRRDEPKIWVYRGLFPLIWALMLVFSLFQAARVNAICVRIQKVALEMRVFGYKGASILDLDSFIQFVMFTKLKAKMFHVPILPSYLIFFGIISSFLLLILLQTSSIGYSGYIL